MILTNLFDGWFFLKVVLVIGAFWVAPLTAMVWALEKDEENGTDRNRTIHRRADRTGYQAR